MLAFLLAGVDTKTVFGQSVSQAPLLQFYEARWDVIEDRMADVFEVGYGGMWVPPVARAGSVFSVGYDVFDRFDLGSPGDETHYGTGAMFGSMVGQANRAAVDVYPDLIVNHNGFGNRTDANFVAQGGYPGFALTLPGVDINGDFHDPFLDWTVDPVNGQLFGLNDIAQEKNHQFVRHPVDASNPQNIPSGTVWNKPKTSNAQFYPDQDLGGLSVFDPELGQSVTLYDFNSADPLQGDAVMENSVGLLMRNVRWMIQKYGVKGFRVDAAKHSPEFTLDYIDQAVFRAIQDLQHDGSIQPAYLFSEIADGNKGYVQSFIRQDLPNREAIDPGNTTVGGNRDVLDFPLFFAMRDNLTANGVQNNWHDIRGASQDSNDRPGGTEVWHTDGSQGVAFVQSHDDFGPHLENVAYAYTLMRPGNALVYFNAEQYGPTGFPKAGKVDSLGGLYGETITKLVEIRNSHGRGDFTERWIDDAFNPNGFSNVYVYERENSAIVGLNSRTDTGSDQRSPVQTSFEPGTILVELTGNATDPTVDPASRIPDSVLVNASGQVTLNIPRNSNHGRGYVIYGPATPQGTLNLTNVATTLAGGTPTAGTNGTTRLADVEVIRSDSFDVQLTTQPVSVPDPSNPGTFVRDYSADGDQALLRFDNGIDLNSFPGIDNASPGSHSYGFEAFTDARVPGYIDDGFGNNIGTGTGDYVQTIDTTQLGEGRHYITARVFRQRSSGPAIFQDFKKTIYIDRLPPESQISSFAMLSIDPSTRTLVIDSVDGTATGVHVFVDTPESFPEAQLLARAAAGQGALSEVDVDQWEQTLFSVSSGNHVVTVVTFEPTYDGVHGYNIQRFTGQYTQTDIGLGLGDVNKNDLLDTDDLLGLGRRSFEFLLFSQNSQFEAAADLDGDGNIDNDDLFALDAVLVDAGAAPSLFDDLDELLRRRGDITRDGLTDGEDVSAIYDAFGTSSWLEDLNVDGIVDSLDVQTLISDLVQTNNADFDLDGDVDGADFFAWQRGAGALNGGAFPSGDADLNTAVDELDLTIWEALYAGGHVPLGVAVPEPTTTILVLPTLFLLAMRYRSE